RLPGQPIAGLALVRGVLEGPLRARAGAESDVASPEVRQHRGGGEQVADEDGPPAERPQERLVDDLDQAEEEASNHVKSRKTARSRTGSRSAAASRTAARIPNRTNAAPWTTEYPRTTAGAMWRALGSRSPFRIAAPSRAGV